LATTSRVTVADASKAEKWI